MSQTSQTGFAGVTPNDRSGILYIAAVLSFIYTTLSLFTRIVIKWRILGLDDAAMMIAQIVNVIQFALLLRSLSRGLGKSYEIISDDQYAQLASAHLGGQITLYIILGLSKIATILLVRRLFMKGMQIAYNTCNVVVCAMLAFTISSALLVSARCSSEGLSPRTLSEVCSGIETRYMVVVVTDAISDLGLAIMPAYLCRNLLMKFTFKLQVLYVFAFRLLLIPLAILFFRSWQSSLDSKNAGVSRTTALIFQQAQLCVSLIAGTLPCLRSFIQSFDTGSGVKAGFGNTNSSDYGRQSKMHQSGDVSNHNEKSYQMTRLPCAIEGKKKQAHESSSVLKPGADTAEHAFEMERCSTQDSDRKSHLSTQELFIRKDVRWEVKTEIQERQ